MQNNAKRLWDFGMCTHKDTLKNFKCKCKCKSTATVTVTDAIIKMEESCLCVCLSRGLRQKFLHSLHLVLLENSRYPTRPRGQRASESSAFALYPLSLSLSLGHKVHSTAQHGRGYRYRYRYKCLAYHHSAIVPVPVPVPPCVYCKFQCASISVYTHIPPSRLYLFCRQQ